MSTLRYDPVTYGPVWLKTAEGYALPQHTIGDTVVGWVEDNLLDPSTGEAPKLTDSQIRRLLWFYAIDEQGKFLYREWSYVGHRGSGKSWFGMLLACVEFVGPCRFAGWDDEGYAIAQSNGTSWVMVLGTGQDATRNSSTYLGGMLTSQCIADNGIDLGKQISYAHGGKRLEFVTSSARGLMGARPSLTVFDEPHMMTLPQDHELFRTARDNAAKGSGKSRIFLSSNCWATDQDSVMQRRFEAYEKAVEKGVQDQIGIVVDMLSAPSDIDITLDTAPALLECSFADSHWMRVEDILPVVLDPGQSTSDTRRFWLSQPVAADDAMFTLRDWEIGLDNDIAPLQVNDRITLGCDPSLAEDSTALVAIRLSDCSIHILHLQEKPYAANNWEIDREALDSAVRQAFDNYDVVAFRSDLNPLASYVDSWARDYDERLKVKASTKSSIGWSMTGGGKELVDGVQRLQEDMQLRNLVHIDDKALKRHILNVRKRGTRWGVTITKSSPDSSAKIDIVAALLLANMARTQYLNNSKPERPKSGLVFL